MSDSQYVQDYELDKIILFYINGIDPTRPMVCPIALVLYGWASLFNIVIQISWMREHNVIYKLAIKLEA